MAGRGRRGGRPKIPRAGCPTRGGGPQPGGGPAGPGHRGDTGRARAARRRGEPHRSRRRRGSGGGGARRPSARPTGPARAGGRRGARASRRGPPARGRGRAPNRLPGLGRRRQGRDPAGDRRGPDRRADAPRLRHGGSALGGSRPRAGGVAPRPGAAPRRPARPRGTPLTAPRLSVVIPAFNEAERLPRTLARVNAYLSARGAHYEIVLVHDASTDGTAGSARAAGGAALTLLRHQPNRGKGYAVRRGMLAARG